MGETDVAIAGTGNEDTGPVLVPANEVRSRRSARSIGSEVDLGLIEPKDGRDPHYRDDVGQAGRSDDE
jgi:hypothetical protein